MILTDESLNALKKGGGGIPYASTIILFLELKNDDCDYDNGHYTNPNQWEVGKENVCSSRGWFNTENWVVFESFISEILKG